MKIDILTPIRFGGPQKWGDDLVRALNKVGIEANNIHSLGGFLKRFFYTNADVIHTTLPLFFTFHRKPVVLTIHGNYNKEKYYKYLYPLAIKRANKITVPSQYLKDQIKLEKAIVIPNGIFPEDYKVVKHKEKDTINIVTVTGFKFWEKARGVIELFKILEQVKSKTKKKFVFKIMGDGPFIDKIKEESKKYNIHIEFMGFHKNPKEILQESDIFVYYSFLDNLPISIIEALACNLPVVSNDVGAVKEITEVSITNDDFENNLVSIINKKSGKTKTSKIKDFYWDNLIKRFIEVYGR